MLSEALQAVLGSGALEDVRGRAKRDRLMSESFDARRRALSEEEPAAYTERPLASGNEAMGIGLGAILAALAGANPEGVNAGVSGFLQGRGSVRDTEGRNARARMEREQAERRRRAGLAEVDADQLESMARAGESDRAAMQAMRESRRREERVRTDAERVAKEKAVADVQDALSNPRSVLGVELAVQRAKQLGLDFDPRIVEQAKVQAQAAQERLRQQDENQRRIGFDSRVRDLRTFINDKVNNFETYTVDDERAFNEYANQIKTLFPEYAGVVPPVPPSQTTFRQRAHDEAKRKFDENLKFLREKERNDLANDAANLKLAEERLRLAQRSQDDLRSHREAQATRDLNKAAAKLREGLDKKIQDAAISVRTAQAQKDSAGKVWTRYATEAAASGDSDPDTALNKRVQKARDDYDKAIAELEARRAGLAALQQMRNETPQEQPVPAGGSPPKSQTGRQELGTTSKGTKVRVIG